MANQSRPSSLIKTVLVIGYRKGLIHALDSQGISYVIWHDKNLPSRFRGGYHFVGPFFKSKRRVEDQLNGLKNKCKVSHVLASVERSVYTASLARRVLNARISQHSTILRCFDKFKMKAFLSEHAIPMAQFTKPPKTPAEVQKVNRLGKPLVLKKRRGSGGKDIRFLDKSHDPGKYAHHNEILEAFVKGRELSVESFIQEGKILFTNITTYEVKTKINILPARFSKEKTKRILALNQKVIEALKIDWGMTHVEMYDSDSGLVFGEVALRPPGGYIMELLSKAYQIDAWQAFLAIEFGLPFQFPEHSHLYTSAYIFTPPAGILGEVTGESFLKQEKAIWDWSIKVKVGDKIEVRDRVGQDGGRALLAHKDYKHLNHVLKDIEKNIIFVVQTG